MLYLLVRAMLVKCGCTYAKLLQLCWIGINIYLFTAAYIKYDQGDEWFYLRKYTGPFLALARAPAACLNLNCMLIILPVCRNVLVLLRRLIFFSRTLRNLLEHNIEMHKWCAYSICLFTGVHLLAHVFNVIYLFNSRISSTPLVTKLNTLIDGECTNDVVNGTMCTYINPVDDSTIDAELAVFKLFGGWSGVIISLALVFIVTSAAEPIRRSFFELFWYTHHLFVVFFVFLIIHGYGRQIRGQINLADHDPHVCEEVHDQWGSIPECPLPQFAGSPPATWKWVVVPFGIYLIERLLRVYHAVFPAQISKIVMHPSRVVEIQLNKHKFSLRGDYNDVGEYIFIKVNLSVYETTKST